MTFTVGTATGSGCIPNSAGVSICSPTAGQTYDGSVTITSGAKAQSGYITAMRVYIDNNALFTSYNPSQSSTYDFTENLGITTGTHDLVVVAYESTGAALTQSVTFKGVGTPCMPTSGFTVNICSPSAVGTTTSPLTVQADANAGTGYYVAAIRVYLDNVAVATIDNPQKSSTFTINQSVPASAGKHYLAVVAYETTGASVSSTEYVTVQ